MPTVSDIEGIGKTVTDKLATIGITEVDELASADIKSLISAGISEGKAKTYIEKAQNHRVKNSLFKSGKEALASRKRVKKLTTNVPEINDLLGGGIETNSITEFYGEFGSGKSQFVHQLAVNTMLPVEKGGLDGYVLWVDTERTFRPESRFAEMVRGVEKIHGIKMDVDECIDHLIIATPMSVAEQVKVVEQSFEIARDMAKEGKHIRMIIVDSLTSNFRAEFCGREQLPERQQTLLRHMTTLYKFAEEFDAVAIVTNQVQSNPAVFFGDPMKPIGGNIVGHTSKSRLALRRGKKGSRVLKLVDSPDRPDGEALFWITTEGIIPYDWKTSADADPEWGEE